MACGYRRFCNSRGRLPSTSSRLPSTYSSSNRSSSKAGDQGRDSVATTAERRICGRTSRRQRLVVARLPPLFVRFASERTAVETSVGAGVAGDFRWTGMWSFPRNGGVRRLPSSQPVPSFRVSTCTRLRQFVAHARVSARQHRVSRTQNVIIGEACARHWKRSQAALGEAESVTCVSRVRSASGRPSKNSPAGLQRILGALSARVSKLDSRGPKIAHICLSSWCHVDCDMFTR